MGLYLRYSRPVARLVLFVLQEPYNQLVSVGPIVFGGAQAIVRAAMVVSVAMMMEKTIAAWIRSRPKRPQRSLGNEAAGNNETWGRGCSP